MTETARAGGRMTRWLLLACTVLGLTAMHTLGHAGMTGHLHRPAMTVSTQAWMPAVTAAGQALSDAACSGDHCPAMPGHTGADVWSVCLAILTGLAGVALLAILLFRLLRRGASTLRRYLPAGMPPRAPPGRAAGLTLSATSVLRI